MMIDHTVLRSQRLDLAGVETLVEWAQAEGWNPGAHDAAAFWQTDPKGFMGYHLDGALIAGGSIVSYHRDFGFMGLFIVHPAWRQQGIGRQLWQRRKATLLKRLRKNAAIGMDGVVEMQDFYAKGGFKLAFREGRFACTGSEFVLDPHLSAIQPADFTRILDYDVKCFGYYRPQFLEAWLRSPDRHTFKYLDGGQVQGYAVLRKVDQGYKIGPLFAEREQVAEALYRACLNAVPGQAVYLDIPVVNRAAVNLVKRHEAEYVLECGRMYYGAAPALPIQKIYGITTFELG